MESGERYRGGLPTRDQIQAGQQRHHTPALGERPGVTLTQLVDWPLAGLARTPRKGSRKVGRISLWLSILTPPSSVQRSPGAGGWFVLDGAADLGCLTFAAKSIKLYRTV